MFVVYLVIFNFVEELCLDLEEQKAVAEAQGLQLEESFFNFKSQTECIYNVRVLAITAFVVGLLVYMPIKIHFALVLRAYYKTKQDQNMVLRAKELSQREH